MNVEQMLEKNLRWVKESSMVEVNKADILSFDKEYQIRVSPRTRLMRLKTLRAFARYIEKPFRNLVKEDIIDFFSRWRVRIGRVQETQKPSDSSIRNMKITIKLFFRWLYGTEDYPPAVKWLEYKYEPPKLNDKILIASEIKKMISVADNSRDKAIVSFMFESGVRISEFLGMNIFHVKPDQYGAQVMVSGKTGERTLRVIESVPYIMDWLKDHPFKEDTNYPLWISLGKNYGERLAETSLRTILKKLMKRSGINRKVYPHMLRHSSCTRYAKLLKEPEMRLYYGWTKSSRMPEVYVHLTDRDVGERILQINGLTDAGEKKDDSLMPRKCPRCDAVNPATAKFCYKCSYAFDYNALKELEGERKNIDDFMNFFIKDPEAIKLIGIKKDEWLKRDKNAKDGATM